MNSIQKADLSSGIKQKAHELGFNICGIAKSRKLARVNGPWIKSSVDAGMNDIMGYLARDIDKRINPETIFPGRNHWLLQE